MNEHVIVKLHRQIFWKEMYFGFFFFFKKIILTLNSKTKVSWVRWTLVVGHLVLLLLPLESLSRLDKGRETWDKIKTETCME